MHPLSGPNRFPVVGRTGSSNQPIIGHILHGEYCVLEDGRVTTPLGERILPGRINLAAPGMDFSLIEVRGGKLYCPRGDFLAGAAPARPDPPGSPSPLSLSAMLPPRDREGPG